MNYSEGIIRVLYAADAVVYDVRARANPRSVYREHENLLFNS